MIKYTSIKSVSELIEKSEEIYIVGGTVRDFLTGRDTKDIDIVVKTDPIRLIEGKKFIVLDEVLNIYRIIEGNLTIDISKMQGGNIEEDLSRRDFTINAIAYDPKKEKFIDPFNGIDDLNRRILRVVKPENLVEDPVRLIRAFRFWLLYKLRFEKETYKEIERRADLISSVAMERVKEELVKIVNYKNSARAIFLLYKSGILTSLISELKKAQEFENGKLYGSNLLEHLIYTYMFAERLVNRIKELLPEEIVEALKEETEAGLTKLNLIKLGAFFHDIAKPVTFAVKNGTYTFWGHDKIGAKITKETLKTLKFSSKTAGFVSRLVENHMRLHLLARTGEITDRAKGRFFRELGIDGIAVIIVSLADSLASSGFSGYSYLLPFAKEMIDFYMKLLKKMELRKPLLNGHEVMEILNIGPGPIVGEILKRLLDAQTEGVVRDKEEAKRFILEEFGNGQG